MSNNVFSHKKEQPRGSQRNPSVNFLSNKFQEVFDRPAEVYSFAPGRINVLGEHVDYHQGVVLPAAIDASVYIAISAREDAKINIHSLDFSESHHTELGEINTSEKDWPNYVLGVIDQIQKRGNAIRGFDLCLKGEVPLGAGLSSSAAVECAVAVALNDLFDLNIDRKELAGLCQLAEHTFVGVKCGIMDQFASLMGKENHVVKLDCRSLEFKLLPSKFDNHSFLLLNTNVSHSLASSAYNERRAESEEGLNKIKIKYPYVESLRDVEMDMLENAIPKDDRIVYNRCQYVLQENQRVEEAAIALINSDLVRLGELMYDAHEGLSEKYEVSCAELDFLVKLSKDYPQVLGARMMGGGFGGCTLNLVENNFVKDFSRVAGDHYKKKFGIELTPIIVHIGDGADVINIG